MQAHDGAMTTEPVIWAWLPLFCWVVIVILELTAYYKIMRMRPGAIWKQLIFPVGFDHVRPPPPPPPPPFFWLGVEP